MTGDRPLEWDETDDMCPNCQTPWKCNGPHDVSQTPWGLRQTGDAHDAHAPTGCNWVERCGAPEGAFRHTPVIGEGPHAAGPWDMPEGLYRHLFVPDGLPAPDPADAPGAAGAGPAAARGQADVVNRDQYEAVRGRDGFYELVAAPDVVGATQVLTPATDSTLTAASEGLLDDQVRAGSFDHGTDAWGRFRDRLAAIEAEVRKDERGRGAVVLNRIKGECRGWFGGSVDNRLLTVELLVDAALAAMEADR